MKLEEQKKRRHVVMKLNGGKQIEDAIFSMPFSFPQHAHWHQMADKSLGYKINSLHA